MMKISAVRHNADSKERPSSESEEEETSPWPTEENAPSFSSYSTFSEPNDWATFEWSNRNGKSVPRDLPQDQHYRLNLLGRTAAELFKDFPEPKNEDLSSGDDDFAVVFPSPRPRRSRRSPSDPLHYSLPNDRLTQKQAGFPSISAETHSYEYPYSGLPHENSDFNLPNFVLQDEEIGRRRGKQLFDVDTQIDQYFPSSSLSMDMSAKASGKQRSNEVSNESSIPISDLRLGIESQPSMELRRSRNPPYLEDEDEDEYVDPRSRKSAGQSSGIRAGRSRDAATRSGKRHVTPEEEDDESALDQSADALSPLAGSPVKTSGKKRKVNRYPCPVPSCKETFTRRNDVRRHIRNAAVHRDSPEALALIGEVVGAGTRCKYCNADLSRSDARMRHERASACGKRTTQKMKDQMLLMKA